MSNMNNDISRYSKRFVQYFWDPMPRNDSEAPIWCLGKRYESHPIPTNKESRTASVNPTSPAASTSPASAVDSALASDKGQSSEDESFEKVEQADASETDEGLANGWPAPFLEDLESKIWLTYRSNFSPIPKSTDPKATSAMSFATRLKQLGNQGGFSSDTGWGCMIRSGQTLLANTLVMLQLGREWRRSNGADERDLLSLFADDSSAPFSIHRFVEHGAAACGKHPGEWFGPSATARCIRELTNAHHPLNLCVYVRPDDSDVYEDAFLQVARREDGKFKPTLVLLGTRLGIDRVTPVYCESLKKALEMPQSVGIAGGRPSSSHYFIGTQGSSFFYLDPHTTRPFLPLNPSSEDIATCHNRRLRSLDVTEMDPSMLLGFLIRSEDEWREWRTTISTPCTDSNGKKGKPIVHVHDTEPKYASSAGGSTQGERQDAVDEVQSCDESDDETVVC